jgi:LPS export ABC transporter protein LptC
MLTRRNAVWLVPLVLTAAYPLWYGALAGFLAPRGGFDPSYGETEKESYNFRLKMPVVFEYKDGRQSTIIRAQTGYSTEKPDVYALEAVDADIFNAYGDTTHIAAKKGIFQATEKLLTLSDNVIIEKKGDNQRLYSDLLYYDDKKQTVTCPGPTRLTGENIDLTGSSFFYDVGAGRSEIGGRVNFLIDQRTEL